MSKSFQIFDRLYKQTCYYFLSIYGNFVLFDRKD